jgi:hypothetical protein
LLTKYDDDLPSYESAATVAPSEAPVKKQGSFLMQSSALTKARSQSTIDAPRKIESNPTTGRKSLPDFEPVNEKELWHDKLNTYERQYDAWTLLTSGDGQSKKIASELLVDFLDVKTKGT